MSPVGRKHWLGNNKKETISQNCLNGRPTLPPRQLPIFINFGHSFLLMVVVNFQIFVIFSDNIITKVIAFENRRISLTWKGYLNQNFQTFQQKFQNLKLVKIYY